MLLLLLLQPLLFLQLLLQLLVKLTLSISLFLSEAEILDLRPDPTILNRITDLDPGGICATAHASPQSRTERGVDFVSRFFSPNCSVFEVRLSIVRNSFFPGNKFCINSGSCNGIRALFPRPLLVCQD